MSEKKVESNLVLLLDGGGHLNEPTQDLCDFTLAEQNAATEAQGVQPSAASDFVPLLGRTVNYIVACVLLNEQMDVLMMQEAKESCAGKWYLPAGRMEQGEPIVDAAVREVLEETGLHIAVTTLLAVECAAGSWYRFVMTGNVLGGELKTPARADAESLQAKWIQTVGELSLRANDIIPLIELARTHARQRTNDPHLWHGPILPAAKALQKNYLRVVAVIKKRATNRLHVLLSEKTTYHFPTVEVHPGRSVHATLRKFLIELFGAELPQHRPHGILSVEHSPTTVDDDEAAGRMDGICLTILVAFRPALEDVSLLGKCVWQELSKEIDGRLISVLSSKNATIALHVLR